MNDSYYDDAMMWMCFLCVFGLSDGSSSLVESSNRNEWCEASPCRCWRENASLREEQHAGRLKLKSLIGYEPHTKVDVDQKNMRWFVGFARRFYTMGDLAKHIRRQKLGSQNLTFVIHLRQPVHMTRTNVMFGGGSLTRGSCVAYLLLWDLAWKISFPVFHTPYSTTALLQPRLLASGCLLLHCNIIRRMFIVLASPSAA